MKSTTPPKPSSSDPVSFPEQPQGIDLRSAYSALIRAFLQSQKDEQKEASSETDQEIEHVEDIP